MFRDQKGFLNFDREYNDWRTSLFERSVYRVCEKHESLEEDAGKTTADKSSKAGASSSSGSLRTGKVKDYVPDTITDKELLDLIEQFPDLKEVLNLKDVDTSKQKDQKSDSSGFDL